WGTLPREVGDLAGVPPGVPVQPATLAGGGGDGEVALARERAPEQRAVDLANAAAVRRDDERDLLAVVAGREEQPRRPNDSVVGDVVDEPRLDPRGALQRLLGGARDRDQHERKSHNEEKPHAPYRRSRIEKMQL